MKRHLLTAAFFAAAVISYALDASSGVPVFLVLGGLSELAGWRRLLHHKH
jgi:hypothetical protein